VNRAVANLEDRIARDPEVCGGDPVFKGTRVTLRTVLASLAAGDSTAEILADFPGLNAADIQAAIAFAAASAEEDLPVPAVPHVRSRPGLLSLTAVCSWIALRYPARPSSFAKSKCIDRAPQCSV